VAHLTRELRAQGHDVRILTSRFGGRGGAPPDPALEPHTYRLGPSWRFPYNGGMASVTYALDLPHALDQLLARESFDIVHVHNPMTPVLPLLALDRSPALNVGTFHSYHPSEKMIEMWHWVLRDRMPRLHLRLAVSASAQAAFQRYFGAEFEVVPNGVDLMRFAPNGHVPAANGEQSLLFVGQLVPKKGLPVLLDAFELLLEEFPRLQLRVVGDGPLGPECRKRLGARSRHRVEFLGELHGAALVECYRECDIFCATSTGHESLGITLLEAMAAGKPIAAARIAGYSDVVREGCEALLYDGSDPRSLRDALRRLIADAGLRQSLARGGRTRVQEYGWPSIAARVAAAYERLVRDRC
jgi:phosphatidylinositol alpha-mannosyltransferase